MQAFFNNSDLPLLVWPMIRHEPYRLAKLKGSGVVVLTSFSLLGSATVSGVEMEVLFIAACNFLHKLVMELRILDQLLELAVAQSKPVAIEREWSLVVGCRRWRRWLLLLLGLSERALSFVRFERS